MEIGEKTLEIMNTAGWYNNWLLKQIAKHLKGDILEVGAGIGNFTSKLSKYGNITAIDYDPNYKNANYGDIEKGKYFFGKNLPAARLPAGQGRQESFDTIVCMNVLEHIKDDRKALKNMFSLLNKNGKLILLVPAHQWAYGQMDAGLGHFRRYTKIEVERKLHDSRFLIQDSRYLNWLGLIGWFINAKILKRKTIPEGQLGLFDKLARPFLILEEFIRPPFGLSVLAIGEKK